MDYPTFNNVINRHNHVHLRYWSLVGSGLLANSKYINVDKISHLILAREPSSLSASKSKSKIVSANMATQLADRGLRSQSMRKPQCYKLFLRRSMTWVMDHPIHDGHPSSKNISASWTNWFQCSVSAVNELHSNDQVALHHSKPKPRISVKILVLCRDSWAVIHGFESETCQGIHKFVTRTIISSWAIEVPLETSKFGFSKPWSMAGRHWATLGDVGSRGR